MIGLVAVTAAGRAAAASLVTAWPAEVHLIPLSNGSDALTDAWQNYDAVVSFLNVGATVRVLAPLLGDKTTDPAVVCVDEAREFAVAVLGGHHGANTLARRVGEVLGCRPVITTASDQANLPALDSFGADLGFTVQNPELLAKVGAAVLSGDPVRLENPGRWPIPPLPENVVATDPEPSEPNDAAVAASSVDGPPPGNVGPGSALGLGAEAGAAGSGVEDPPPGNGGSSGSVASGVGGGAVVAGSGVEGSSGGLVSGSVGSSGSRVLGSGDESSVAVSGVEGSSGAPVSGVVGSSGSAASGIGGGAVVAGSGVEGSSGGLVSGSVGSSGSRVLGSGDESSVAVSGVEGSSGAPVSGIVGSSGSAASGVGDGAVVAASGVESPGDGLLPADVATAAGLVGVGDGAVVAGSDVQGSSVGRLSAKVGPPGSGLFGIDDGSVVDPVSFERSERVGPPGSGLLGIEHDAGGDSASVARHEGGSVSGPRRSLSIRISDEVVVPEDVLVYRPKSLVVGVGSARGVGAEEISALVDEALAGYSPLSVRALATIDLKADEVGILEVARRRGWEVLTYPAEILDRIPVPNPSAVVRAEVGTGSVAEAAALAASESLGTKGLLVCEKRKSAGATVAVARLTPRGRLSIVGLGPGARDLVTPRAVASLRRAAVIVGLDQYVDQVRDLLAPGTRIVASGLGQEEERARRAVAEAAAGRAVALVGSGDAGVYAMASPALEFAGRDIDVDGVPGITAAVAASAMLGAPLGHDHAYISLSDLHTPWEIIERRVRAAAEGDFTVCFYNPRSRQRDWQLPESLKILGGGRPPATPVGLVRNATRADQTVTITTLGELDVTMVDMFTVVIVGSSRSRTIQGRFVTPRGYRWSESS